MLRRLLFLALAAGLAAGCEGRRTQVEKELAKADAPRLRHEAAVVYKDALAPRQAAFVSVPPENWPASFAAFHPMRVNVYRDGLALVFDAQADLESGLYLIPEGMTHDPATSPRSRFTELKEGVYWYEFGDAK